MTNKVYTIQKASAITGYTFTAIKHRIKMGFLDGMYYAIDISPKRKVTYISQEGLNKLLKARKQGGLKRGLGSEKGKEKQKKKMEVFENEAYNYFYNQK